jgi:hypothetical protein
MSVSAPYCTTGDVYLMRLFMQNVDSDDFRTDGIPRKSVVSGWVDDVASQIDMAYSSAGYTIPFTAITGETWPTHQTTFLKYFNAVGVASLIGGDASMPSVVEFVRGERVERSFYEAEWMRLMGGVRALANRQPDTTVLIRAANRAGSAADYLLSDVSPPLMDFLEGYDDPTKWDRLRDFTNRSRYHSEALLEYNEPSWANSGSMEYLYYIHLRQGYTYDS